MRVSAFKAVHNIQGPVPYHGYAMAVRRRRPYSALGNTGGETAAAAGVGVGLLVVGAVVTVGLYLLLAYGVGWAATKGYQKAKRR